MKNMLLVSCEEDDTPMKDEITFEKHTRTKILHPADIVGEINKT